ncbi:MAG TPA: condensation domain-containing protein, partial [Burkholderiaceae bacterium]|nr:condensation domain-containing protein [Burkholderiaceae bacterium]
IGDGWSFGILIQEATTLYRDRRAGRAWHLPELRLQYGDFARWQRQWLNDHAFIEQMDYWRRQLKDLPPLALTANSRKAKSSMRYSVRRWVQLPAELSHRLKALAAESHATLFMTLLAGLQTLIYRYTGQPEFAIGSPIANRRHAETERLIGFFVNMLVLRTDLSGNPSFCELLRRVRQTCLEAYTHQDVPFEKIVKELAPERSSGGTPLLDVVFALENGPRREVVNLPGLATGRAALPHGYARFDLTVLMVDMPAGLELTVEFDRELFAASEMDLLVRRFEALLRAVAEKPELRLLDIPITSNSTGSLSPIQADNFDF